jgi:hypothetical protein
MGRINSTGNGWDGNPNGYYMRLYPDGGCQLYVANQGIKGSRERRVAVGSAKRWRWNQWHNIKLRFSGSSIVGFVDDVQVFSEDNNTFGNGLAGLATGGEGNARNTAIFDNLMITPISAGKPSPTIFVQDSYPIYQR